MNVDTFTNAWQLKNNTNKHDLFEKEKKKQKKLSSSHNKKSNSLINVKSVDASETNSRSSPQEDFKEVKDSNELQQKQHEPLEIADSSIKVKQRSSSTSYLNEQDDYGEDKHIFSNNEPKKFHRQLSLDENLTDEAKVARQPDTNNLTRMHKSNESDLDDNISMNSRVNLYNEESDKSTSSSNESSDTSDSEDNGDLYAIYENDETIQMVDCDPGGK